MIKITAALFDLDGTLADSLTDIAGGANHSLAACGYPARRIDDFKSLVGDGLTSLIIRLLPEDANTQEIIEKIRDLWLGYYGEHCLDTTRPYDGMPETLAELKKRGVKLAVITNKQQEIAQKIVRALYGADMFDCVLGIRTGVPVKPDPFLAFEALRICGITNGRGANRFDNKKFDTVVYVGDTATDMLTAKNSGCVPVGALWGFRTLNELREAGAEYLLEKPADLLEICS